MRRPTRIYVCKPIGFNGPYKVGATCDVQRRMRHIDNASPFQMELICECAGDVELERRCHAYLRDRHIRCEWFEDSPEVDRIIGWVKAGSLAEAPLPPPQHVANFIRGQARQSTAKAAYRPESEAA